MIFGLPGCANRRCPSGLPGILRIEFSDDNGPLSAHLCPFCVTEAPALLREMAAVRRGQVPLVEAGKEEDGQETQA